MIYTTAVLELEELAATLGQAITTSSLAQDYQTAQLQMAASSTVAEKKAQFLAAKDKFQKVAEYGQYAPDYRQLQIAMGRAKRHLDMLPEVAAFRLAQTQLQQQLDTVTQAIAATVSAEIIVDYGNPIFHQGQKKHHHEHGCSGGCSQHGA